MSDTLTPPVPLFDLGGSYRHVFILDSRDWFIGCRDRFDPARDLVLTYDFGLKLEIETLGGRAFFVDHLVDAQVMQANNFLAYAFFRDWHRDAAGDDIFAYRGIPFGFSFRINFWNDYMFYVRARLCLDTLRALRFEALFAGTALGLVEAILDEMRLGYQRVDNDGGPGRPIYYFPIHGWMTENIRRRGLKSIVLDLATWGLGTLLAWWDRLRPRHRRKPAVFVQHYHPTHAVIQRLRDEGRVRVVSATVSRRVFWSRYIPIWPHSARFQPAADRLLDSLRARRHAQLILSNGLDITDGAYRIIERSIASRVAPSIRILESVINHLRNDPFDLELLVSNIGDVVALVDCACRSLQIPSYLIVNGLLGPAFTDESKYATVINAYSTSIQAHYFRGMSNTVALGDPRMDQYPPMKRRPLPANGAITVTIGASGHNNVELNSYVAVEFDFMFDVLQTLAGLRHRVAALRIVIKVRPNGYRAQYERFAAEYFPGLVVEIVDRLPMAEVLARSDFFISIYSQALFEASCLGVPCVYYRKDNEIQFPPFDGQSELVTADTVEALTEVVEDFLRGDSRFDPFLDRAVMEQYIGPLDGGNVQRNLDFLYGLVEPTVATS